VARVVWQTWCSCVYVVCVCVCLSLSVSMCVRVRVCACALAEAHEQLIAFSFASFYLVSPTDAQRPLLTVGLQTKMHLTYIQALACAATGDCRNSRRGYGTATAYPLGVQQLLHAQECHGEKWKKEGSDGFDE